MILFPLEGVLWSNTMLWTQNTFSLHFPVLYWAWEARAQAQAHESNRNFDLSQPAHNVPKININSRMLEGWTPALQHFAGASRNEWTGACIAPFYRWIPGRVSRSAAWRGARVACILNLRIFSQRTFRIGVGNLHDHEDALRFCPRPPACTRLQAPVTKSFWGPWSPGGIRIRARYSCDSLIETVFCELLLCLFMMN